MTICKDNKKISLTTVTPVYSGANYIELLVAELKCLRDTWIKEDFPVCLTEAIFVDDDAIDDSPTILDKLSAQYEWVHVIHMSRNFGQHPATIAGILHSSSDWVVTLDEDLQHRPHDIKTLFSNIAQERYDVVYANPTSSVHETWYRDLGSRGFKKIMVYLTGNHYITFFNSFRLIRGTIARAAASICTHSTYFDIALLWFTKRIGSETMNLKDERMLKSKKSGYSFFSLLSHARRMIVSSNTKVFRIGAIIGLISLFIAVGYGLFVFLGKMVFPEYFEYVRGWTSLLLSILFFGGVISFLVTAILEYLFVVLLHTQGKPTFFSIDRQQDSLLKDYFNKM